MAEFTRADDTEERFDSLEKEILSTFQKLINAIEDKRKEILDIFARFRHEYSARDKNRSKKIQELSQIKVKLTDTDSQDNEVMELQEDTLKKIEARISNLEIQEEFPQLVFKFNFDIEDIIAKFDTFELENNGSGELLNFVYSYSDTDIFESLKKFPGTVTTSTARDTKRASLHYLSLLQESVKTRPITDIKIIASKQQLPVGYSTLEATADGKAVQLWEGWFKAFRSGSKRFLCYTRQTMDAMEIKEGTTKWSRNEVPEDDQIVVTGLRIATTISNEFILSDYKVIEKTVDTNEPALFKQYLLVKYEKKLQTEAAVSQLMFLEEAHISLLPSKFRAVSLPINGYFLCFNSDIFD